jgi:hypothetical protein
VPTQAAEHSDALAEAITIARSHGLTVREPVMLRSTNNVLAWLNPSPVVAKIGAGRASRLALELAVARELAALAAPSVAPALLPPPKVYRASDLDITFWAYHPQDRQTAFSADTLAAGLVKLHRALSRLSTPLQRSLPSYSWQWEDARSLLESSATRRRMAAADRRLLLKTLAQVAAELGARAPSSSHRVIHGAPHLHNILRVDRAPLFIDFETCCSGPLEWDLAYFDDAVAQHYGQQLDARVLWLCQAMTSVTTAIWCSVESHRGDLGEHAAWHLSQVRERIAPRLCEV